MPYSFQSIGDLLRSQQNPQLNCGPDAGSQAREVKPGAAVFEKTAMHELEANQK
jgi:hypothetical protein